MNEPPVHTAAIADASQALDVERVIPLIAETLHVERRTLEGVVRVRKLVHEQPVEVDETAREERLTVRRVPVGRAVDAAPAIRQEGDVTIVPVLEERLVVEKRLVLVEELHLTRETRTQRVPQRLSLRREQLVVERLDPRTQEWSVLDAPITPAPATAKPRVDARPSPEPPEPDNGPGFVAPAQDASR